MHSLWRIGIHLSLLPFHKIPYFLWQFFICSLVVFRRNTAYANLPPFAILPGQRGITQKLEPHTHGPQDRLRGINWRLCWINCNRKERLHGGRGNASDIGGKGNGVSVIKTTKSLERILTGSESA